MKFASSVIYLFLLLACSPMMNNNSLVLRDSVTGKEINSCSSYDEESEKKILPSIQGECDHIPQLFEPYHVTRLVINDKVCCVVETFIDHGNGKITPIKR